MLSISLLSLLFLTPFILRVSAHGVLVAVVGMNGKLGKGFGVNDETPRNGSTRDPFQRDTSVFKLQEILKGTASPCGRTILGGQNNISTALQAAVSAGLPSVALNGSIFMTLHQVNGDGAGPYQCGVSADATGTNFERMEVITQVPGTKSNSGAQATDFKLVARLPSRTRCTGGPSGDACIVRCMNSAQAGPFGGCLAVTNPPPRAAVCAAALKIVQERGRNAKRSTRGWWL